jgi:hypothetical protein
MIVPRCRPSRKESLIIRRRSGLRGSQLRMCRPRIPRTIPPAPISQRKPTVRRPTGLHPAVRRPRSSRALVRNLLDLRQCSGRRLLQRASEHNLSALRHLLLERKRLTPRRKHSMRNPPLVRRKNRRITTNPPRRNQQRTRSHRSKRPMIARVVSGRSERI